MEDRFDVTSFGETMLRLSVPAGDRLAAARKLDLHVGGAESNVLGALSALGRRCGWAGCLPANELGQLVQQELRARNVDVSAVQFSTDSRMGLYFAELAHAPAKTRVIYDRGSSAMARVENIDWGYLLQTRVLHLSGILPALSERCAQLALEAIARGRKANAVISFDVNYRSLLWSPDQAAHTMRQLIGDIDILVCSIRDAALLFGFNGTPQGVLCEMRKLSGARWLVLTLGSEGAIALEGEELHVQKSYAATVIDPIGAGDAFVAGLLDGWLDSSITVGLARGAALASLALGTKGDMLATSRDVMMSITAADKRRIIR